MQSRKGQFRSSMTRP
nr:unnamed protein product [Callosobruchus chinensis]